MGAGSKRSVGRPRAFDENDILDRAVIAFATRGFSGTSITDLKAATGLSAGSLYQAFGDKDRLFARVLERYVAVRDGRIDEALAAARSGRDRIADVLALYASLSTGVEGRRGCLVVGGLAELDLVAGHVAVTLRHTLERRRALIEGLIADGQADGSIAPGIAPAVAATLLLTLVQGMRVVGKGGLFPDDPAALVAMMMTVFD